MAGYWPAVQFVHAVAPVPALYFPENQTYRHERRFLFRFTRKAYRLSMLGTPCSRWMRCKYLQATRLMQRYFIVYIWEAGPTCGTATTIRSRSWWVESARTARDASTAASRPSHRVVCAWTNVDNSSFITIVKEEACDSLPEPQLIQLVCPVAVWYFPNSQSKPKGKSLTFRS